MRKRGFPTGVSEYKDRHGKYRLRFRRIGRPTRHFKSQYGTREFELELAAFRQDADVKLEAASQRYDHGTIGDLVTRFFQSTAFRNGAPMTQRKVRSVLDRFRDTVDANGVKYADKSAQTITFAVLDQIIARKAETHPAAAQQLRKQLRRLFEYGVKLGIRRDNPVELTERVKVRVKGFHTWTEEEIAQYQDKHPIGSMPRLAMELLLWTGQRRSDVIRLGHKNIVDGRFVITPRKTEDRQKILRLPIAFQLQEAIDAMSVTGKDTFLVNAYGKPFTDAGFGNSFRDWCNQAGLPSCTSHGLRKAMARRQAETGATNQQLKAVGGWSNDSEVSLYTSRAEQAVMADVAITRLSEWDLANRKTRLANSSSQTSRKPIVSEMVGDPYGNRTRVSAVKGPRPNR